MSHRTPVLSYQARHEVLLRFLPTYQQAESAKKSPLLDPFLAATGYTRKHAIRLLNHPEKSKLDIQRPRSPFYGSEVQQALFLAWKATRYVCPLGKRHGLAPLRLRVNATHLGPLAGFAMQGIRSHPPFP